VTASAPPAPATPDAQAAHASALASLDERIAQKDAELARKEAQAREEQAGAEKNLLDLESRRSEILLGKIYRSVQEIARREGVSVVVDKTGILYGHNAVDLTEKVLKHLKGG
jgi:Skp family chaperone for outer membrane proteins